MSGSGSPGLLAASLAVSAQLLIIHLREAGEEARAMLRDRIVSGNLLQMHADDMLYGGKGAAESHAAYAALLALLSFAPGGVRFAGMSFCAAHPGQKWGQYEVCGECLAEERQGRGRPGAGRGAVMTFASPYPDNLAGDFRARLLAEMRNRGHTARSLAVAAGIDPTTLRRFLGEQDAGMRPGTGGKIFAALGIPLEELAAPLRCRRCADRPPHGYACNTCGAGQPEPAPAPPWRPR